MKKSIPLLFICFMPLFVSAQTRHDTVSLGEEYTMQSFYSLADGEISNIDNTNWDLAFDMSSFGSTVRINGGTGTELYLYPKDDTTGWSSIDTTGLSGWGVLHNSDTSWWIGAFNQNQANELDLGWGMYNTISHKVTGDSLYIIKLSSGDWKKIWIENLQGGVFNFRYGNLDGSDEVTASISKGDYTVKNFGYYSLQSDTEIDREPANTEWDLVFSKYVTEVAPSLYYGVTGVLSNARIEVAKAYPVDDPLTYQDYQSHTFKTAINTVGHDWKEFDMSTFQYNIADTLCYFVCDQDDNIWRLTFTGFQGSSTGNVMFHKQLMVATSQQEHEFDLPQLELFPNPATDIVNLVYSQLMDRFDVAIYDMNGKQVFKETFEGNEFGNHGISLEEFHKGLYFVTLSSGNTVTTKKLVIQ